MLLRTQLQLLLSLTALTVPACANIKGPLRADHVVQASGQGDEERSPNPLEADGDVDPERNPLHRKGIRLVDAESAALPPEDEREPALERSGSARGPADAAAIHAVPLAEAEAVGRSAVDGSGSAALDLVRLQQLALQNNPTLAQARAVVDKARGISEQVGQAPNPLVGYFGEEMGEAGTAGKQGGFIAQSIITGDKLELNRNVVGWDVEAARWHLDAQRYRILTDVERTFYEVLGAQRTVETARQLQEVGEEGVRAARELLQEGQGTRTDLLQAEIELNRIRILLDNARNRYDAAWKQLTSLVGRPELSPARLQGSLQERPPKFQWDRTYQELLASSPEYQAALTRIERARAQVRRQDVQPVPNLLARVGVAHDNASDRALASAELGAFLPVFNRNEGNTLAAVAELRRARQNAQRLRLSLRRELASAFQAYGNALQQVQKYETSILPKAQDNLDLTEEGYRVGEFDFLTVLVARRTFFETNLDYVAALTELQRSAALIDGLLLTGGLNDVPDVPGQGPPAGVGLRGEAMSTQ